MGSLKKHNQRPTRVPVSLHGSLAVVHVSDVNLQHRHDLAGAICSNLLPCQTPQLHEYAKTEVGHGGLLGS